jgi:hypothetical protein
LVLTEEGIEELEKLKRMPEESEKLTFFGLEEADKLLSDKKIEFKRDGDAIGCFEKERWYFTAYDDYKE